MRLRRGRLGIRAQLTLIVLLGTFLTTVATLFVANTAITTYDDRQSKAQERENMQIALLELHTEYGRNISISSTGQLVADSPSKDINTLGSKEYGQYPLNGDVDYVAGVQNLIGGAISVYQCADSNGKSLPSGCVRIASTFTSANTSSAANGSTTNAAAPNAASATATATTTPSGPTLSADVYSTLCQRVTGAANCAANGTNHLSATGMDVFHSDLEAGIAYQSDYYPLTNPGGKMIGVLAVSVPVSSITTLQQNTTISLVLLGLIIMIAGVILALLFTSAIVATLQRAARQVSDSSERINGIAAQQAGGSAQQVWAVNAINKALQNFTEMARDISQRTDQLALMGNQVIQRRGEIAPAQIDSILAYITRSVRDISVASRQQASQYERMTGAMQAVIEIADQVANSSQQTTESAEQLNLVVGQLQQLVGIQRRSQRAAQAPGASTTSQLESPIGFGQGGMMGGAPQPTIRAMRPGTMPGMRGGMTAGPGAYRGALPPMGGAPMGGAPMGGPGQPGYGVPAPMTGGMAGGNGMRRGGRPLNDAEMGRMLPAERAPMSGGMGGGPDRRMPLPPMPGGARMPAAPNGRMPSGQGSGMYPRPVGPDGAPRGWGDPGWDGYGGNPMGRMPDSGDLDGQR